MKLKTKLPLMFAALLLLLEFDQMLVVALHQVTHPQRHQQHQHLVERQAAGAHDIGRRTKAAAATPPHPEVRSPQGLSLEGRTTVVCASRPPLRGGTSA